jgi:hypothetical protein
MNGKRVQRRTIEQVIEMYQQGLGSTTIARTLGISKNSVLWHLEKSGVQRRPQPEGDPRASHRKYERKMRRLWGGAPELDFPHEGRQYGKSIEKYALQFILPKLGFSEIYDCTLLSNQFFFDFIATYEGQRVLLDVTARVRAYVPQKINLANALRMRCFLLFVSPKFDGRYYLCEPKNKTTNVPPNIVRGDV